MIALVPYSAACEVEMLRYMAQFFAYHDALAPDAPEAGAAAVDDDSELRQTLAEWLAPPSLLYMIDDDGQSAGFLRIGLRGPQVAWIEDVFVTSDRRGRGIATEAIGAAEEAVAAMPGYTAVCMDVVPRNADALRLYHRLGYGDISLITVRKELCGGGRDKPLRLLGLDFRY